MEKNKKELIQKSKDSNWYVQILTTTDPGETKSTQDEYDATMENIATKTVIHMTNRTMTTQQQIQLGAMIFQLVSKGNICVNKMR